MDMITLYTKSTCPFCHKVKNYLDDKGIAYEEKDIYENDENLDELMEQGGKRQVPYMVDSERGVSMYESEDIIAYVREYFGKEKDVTQE